MKNSTAAAPKTSNRPRRTQGMNWIRQEKRLAIYLRDGLACVYCGAGVEEDAKLTLDHCLPYSKGGSNHESNLVTCCHLCNSARGNKALATFIAGFAAYWDVDGAAVARHIRNCRRRNLRKAEAKALIASRGSVAQVLAHRRQEALDQG